MTRKHVDTRSMLHDMANGFSHFVDETLRGRENKIVLNSSVAVSALEMGVPRNIESMSDLVTKWESLEFPNMVINNERFFADLGNNALHPLFDFDPENFTLFGLDFPDAMNQISQWWEGAPIVSEHHTPYYDESVATSIGLPDLPYGELAHFAHIGVALYDTGRTFQDLWKNPDLHHNALKVMTHPEMAHTLLYRATMLTVMGALHSLGPVVAIGAAYLCAHLVHSAFKLLEGHKDDVQKLEDVPVLKHIYNATGIKEWAEAKAECDCEHELDPYDDMPELHVDNASPQGVVSPNALHASVSS